MAVVTVDLMVLAKADKKVDRTVATKVKTMRVIKRENLSWEAD